jgi:16S rRNA G966 N2-methylase RsmD
MSRKCHIYDVNPVREDIIEHDLVRQGLPKEAENADLIFFDPPYCKKKRKEYGLQSISSQSHIKRILIERDITTLKQAFCRILCAEIRNKDTIILFHTDYYLKMIYKVIYSIRN